MPYAANVYSVPPGTQATTLTPIDSSDYNTFVADIEQAQNDARPIVAGGTGAQTAVAAHDALNTQGTDIASASTLNLDNATGAFIDITGTTTVTAVTLASGRSRIARATGAFQLTASSSLVVNGSSSVNHTTVAGDLLIFEGYGGGVVRVWIPSTSSVPFTAASAAGPASLAFAEDTDNGSNKVTLKAPSSIASDVDVVLPGTADTLVGKATTDTLTNKRITPRVTTITSSATPTINTDDCDAVTITALAAAITSMTTNLSGTPTNFQKLIFRIKDNGTARAISWGSSFEAKGVALPTTTTLGKVLTVGFIYDTVTSKWGCVASVVEA